MKKLLVLIAVLASMVFFPAAAGQVQAQTGVGIMPGKIVVDEPLLPGTHYNLPSLQVINTGDEPSGYEIELARVATQEGIRPPPEFISFTPSSFYLEAGESQVISLKLNLPTNARPGDYLAYIEAHPVSESGGMSVGAAVATKLYFTVSPANIIVGVFTSITTFFSSHAPVSFIVLGVVALGVVVFFLRKHLNFEMNVRRK